MKQQLILDYTIPVGDLAPYFDALQEGKALASKCSECGAVVFPARSGCVKCVGADIHWQELNGNAVVLFRTDGVGTSFALVQFDGAETQTTVAIKNPEIHTSFGLLIAPPNDAAGLWLELTSDETRNNNVR